VAGAGLIAVIVGLDLVSGGNAELLGLPVSPPILAASFVGPNRTVAVGVVALAAVTARCRDAGRSGSGSRSASAPMLLASRAGSA
jgi:type IV secretory pathway TrbL component